MIPRRKPAVLLSRIVVWLAVSFWTAVAVGQVSQHTAPPASADWSIVELPDAPKVPLDVRKDLVYSDVPRRTFDLYQPSGHRARPTVLLLHGSVDPRIEPRPKEWGFFRSYARTLATANMSVLVPNHSLTGQASSIVPATHELLSLLEYISNGGEKLPVDKSAICVIAFSAGGQLIGPLLAEGVPNVRCIIGMYPGLDPLLLHRELSTTEKAELSPYRASSAIHEAHSTKPPIWIFRAGRDAVPGLNPSIDEFATEALKYNWPFTLSNIPEAEHGFENKQRGAATVDVLKQVIGFIHSSCSESHVPALPDSRSIAK